MNSTDFKGNEALVFSGGTDLELSSNLFSGCLFIFVICGRFCVLKNQDVSMVGSNVAL